MTNATCSKANSKAIFMKCLFKVMTTYNQRLVIEKFYFAN